MVRVSQPSLLMNILPQLLLKVRPCFEKVSFFISTMNNFPCIPVFKEDATLRSSAYSLFSGLGSSVGNCEAFRESLHSNIVSIVLHLNDDDEQVRNV
jgi:hypothetical protein